jgi:2-succinyl-6-hydroxy-2,4-cyclohexadiene-1-carboxylate synthase
MNLLALHGFLGTGADWKFLHDFFATQISQKKLNIETPDLFSSPPSQQNLMEEAQTVLQNLQGQADVILGYSYGGRLALEMLLTELRGDPKIRNCKKLILCSSGFGIVQEEKREARRRSDEQWAHDFLTRPWAELLQKWSAQEVLKSGSNQWPGPREEELFNRARLAEALVLRSPAQGIPAMERINRLKIPLLMMVGEADGVYVQFNQEVHDLVPSSQLVIVSGASHRLPWQMPEIFLKSLSEFLFT